MPDAQSRRPLRDDGRQQGPCGTFSGLAKRATHGPAGRPPEGPLDLVAAGQKPGGGVTLGQDGG